MGVDCRIILPHNVRVDDVVKVIGIAAGFKPELIHETWGSYVKVAGVKIENTSVPSMCQINFDGRFVYYHFEAENGKGRLLNPKSTDFWIAIGRRLVDFFGGELDYSDCDIDDVDYARKSKGNNLNCPSNGKPWMSFQNRLMEIKPIHISEMSSGLGAYSSDGYEYTYDDKGYMTRG